jgi:hypothetical protein
MAPALATETARRDALPALSLQDPQVIATVHAVAQKAHEALPLANGRIAKAVKIVLSGGVTLFPDGRAVVASQSRPSIAYSVNGRCECTDAPTAPGQWCKHRIAAALLKRTQDALAHPAAPFEDLPAVELPTPAGLDVRFLTYLHGKAFVRYAGLLARQLGDHCSDLCNYWEAQEQQAQAKKDSAEKPPPAS